MIGLLRYEEQMWTENKDKSAEKKKAFDVEIKQNT